MRNKIFTSFMVATLLYTQTASASFWDDSSVFKNRTSSSVAVDPNTGVSYYSGGGMEIRFKNIGNFPAPFEFGAPGIKASCRGISFDAGYAMFMDLEKLGQQLSQAGTSIAYGILIGLIYTMPGISQAFEKLNEWSKWLQKFLQDSCKIGTNWGKDIGGTVWSPLQGVADGINNGIPSPMDVIEEHPSVKKFIKKVYNEGTLTDKAKANDNIIRQITKKARGGLIARYINTLVAKGEENINFNSSTPVTLNKIDDLNFSTSTVTNAYLIGALVDDISVSSTAMTALSKALETEKVDKLSKLLEDLKKTETVARKSGKNKVSVETIVSYLLNGEINSPLSSLAKIELALISVDNGDGKSENFVMLTDAVDTQKTNVFDAFSGYITESKILISYLYNKSIKELKGTESPYTYEGQTMKVSVAYPMLFELIRNLIIEKGNNNYVDLIGSPKNDEVGQTLQYLAYKNAIELTMMAIENVASIVSDMNYNVAKNLLTFPSGGPGVVSTYTQSTKAIEDVEKQKKSLEEGVKGMKIVLEEYNKKLKETKFITDMSYNLKKSIREKVKRGTR